jgi:hypothetical protein
MTPDGVEAIAALIDGAVPVAQVAVELREAKLTQREALLLISDEAEVWRTPDGELFATVPVADHVEHHPIASRAFKFWMLSRLATRFTMDGRPASANENSFREAKTSVEARAATSGIVQRASLRVAEHDGALLIDQGTDDWSVIRIDGGGWQKLTRSPIPILRGRRAAAFPIPSERGEFGPIRQLLRHLDDETFVLLVAWSLGALMPQGPYPILVLGGEQGAGKSTLARLAQRMTDPVHGDLLQPPHNDRDLIACARNNRVLSFDNLSGLSAELADSMCRLATGSEIGGRALFSDHELASFSACRPLVINGIPDLAARGDLADRSIVLRLPRLPGRTTEREWRHSVEQVLAPTFAALLGALSCGLRSLKETATPNVRMADFARLVVAAEPALPWPPGAFLAALSKSQQQANATLADGDSVVVAISRFVNGTRPDWSGLVSELHTLLSAGFLGTQAPSDWPKNARWLSDRLRRAAPTLRALGIDYAERRTARGAGVTLRAVGYPDTSASFATSQSDPACAATDAGDANFNGFMRR